MMGQIAGRSESVVVGDGLQQSWQRVRDRLRLEVEPTIFERCFKGLALSGMKDGTVVLSAETTFMRDWVRNNHADRLHRLWQVEFPSLVAVDLVCDDVRSIDGARISPPVLEIVPALAPAPIRDLSPSRGVVRAPAAVPTNVTGLDPHYSFATFVAGKGNALAYEAARRIAESDVSVFNPLYIYGPSGVGKSHLMQAIGNAIAARSPSRRIQLIHAETFLSRFQAALRNKDTLAFKETYRSLDVLLIDDVHYMADKQATQEEFFHTVQTLISMRKQVVITAEGPPAKLESIGDRIKSWLGGGMTVDIQPADYDLRLAILKAKAEDHRSRQTAAGRQPAELGSGVLEFLAENLTNSIRDLEGALNLIMGHADLLDARVTVESARPILKDILKPERPTSIDDVMQLVAQHYDARIQDLKSPRRTQGLVRARHVGMWLAREVTQKSFPQIGLRYGGRDHTTVMSAVKKIDRMRAENPSFQVELDTLLAQLRK